MYPDNVTRRSDLICDRTDRQEQEVGHQGKWYLERRNCQMSTSRGDAMKVARGTLKQSGYVMGLKTNSRTMSRYRETLYRHHPNAMLHACNLSLTQINDTLLQINACCLRPAGYLRCKHASGKLTIRHCTSSACGWKA